MIDRTAIIRLLDTAEQENPHLDALEAYPERHETDDEVLRHVYAWVAAAEEHPDTHDASGALCDLGWYQDDGVAA